MTSNPKHISRGTSPSFPADANLSFHSQGKLPSKSPDISPLNYIIYYHPEYNILRTKTTDIEEIHQWKGVLQDELVFTQTLINGHRWIYSIVDNRLISIPTTIKRSDFTMELWGTLKEEGGKQCIEIVLYKTIGTFTHIVYLLGLGGLVLMLPAIYMVSAVLEKNPKGLSVILFLLVIWTWLTTGYIKKIAFYGYPLHSITALLSL